jgi:hypothetical protein
MLPHGAASRPRARAAGARRPLPLAALESATSVGARLLGLDAGEVVRAGAPDLLLVDGDPTCDPEHVVKVTTYLVDPDDGAAATDARLAFFGATGRPTRASSSPRSAAPRCGSRSR